MKQEKKFFSFKKLMIVCLVWIMLSCSILLYSHYIGTSGLITKEFNLIHPSIAESIYGLKIVHISDLHYGTTTEQELDYLVQKINLTKPDIIVFTGDLIDEKTKISSEEEKKIIEYFNKMEANIGKYAIKGNEDHTNWDTIIETSDFVNLNDRYQKIYFNDKDYILLVGMSSNFEDASHIQDKIKEAFHEIEASEIKPNYSILIMHEPDFIEDIDYHSFHLVLAGHSHNGQIRLPGIGPLIKPKYAKKYYEQHYRLDDTDLYISGGIGTSDIDFRLFNRPSFHLYRLVN